MKNFKKHTLSLAIVLAISSSSAFGVTCQDGTNTCVVSPPPGQLAGLDYSQVNLSNKDYFVACGSTTYSAGQPNFSARFVNASFDDGRLDRTSFYGCNMTGAHARGRVSAHGVNFTKSVVTNLALPFADLLDGSFQKARSQGGLELFYANATAVNFKDAVLPRTNADHTNFAKADLQNSKWNGSFFNGAYFATANLVNADLSDSIIHDVNMTCNNLTGVKLAGAHITGSNLSSAVWKKQPDGSYTLAQVASQPAEIGGDSWTTLNGVKHWVTKTPLKTGWTLTPAISVAW